jgi:hypothetical protein
MRPVLEPPTSRFAGDQRSMKTKDTIIQESIGVEHDQLLQQLDSLPLGEQLPQCAVCDLLLVEGDNIVVHAYQRADDPPWKVGYTKCSEHKTESIGEFSEDAHECLIEGRVGKCSDPIEQVAWPILIHPQLETISPVGTTENQKLSGESWFNVTIEKSRPCDLTNAALNDPPEGIESVVRSRYDDVDPDTNHHFIRGDDDVQ